MKSKVVPASFTLTPTPPLLPTRPPMSPVVTADLEVPSETVRGLQRVKPRLPTLDERLRISVDEDCEVKAHHTLLGEKLVGSHSLDFV